MAAGEPSQEEERLARDAARLYGQGWTIRQVAQRFDRSYGVMRRILATQVPLRNRGGATRDVHPQPSEVHGG
ncbi:helix-turn-helix domain-containing protein [Actinomadura sp. DC4]|uniref:helix-turn-helix domain-containing protein n=1 Tax=Actinomadura sp. DC4 TaxID=3055069 RepID=UPI00339D3632